MKIIIESISFKSKKSAKDYVKKILHKYKIGDRISEEDSIFLSNLILLHPEAEQKIGCGIDYFSIEIEPVWQHTKHFTLHRTDGTSTDFSFYSCIDGDSRRKDVLTACREAISDQIITFKVNAFEQGSVTCPIHNIVLNKNNCHVDHTPPTTFANLFSGWLKESGLSLDNIDISQPSDNQWQTRMTNEQQRKSWQDFHKNYAILRIVSTRANLSDIKVR